KTHKYPWFARIEDLSIIDDDIIKTISHKKILRPKTKKRIKLHDHYLDRMKRMLFDSLDIFEKYSIKYWIDDGTLLGIIRDGDLIPWDHDVDVGISGESASKIISIWYKFFPKHIIRKRSKNNIWLPGKIRSIIIETPWEKLLNINFHIDLFVKYEADRFYRSSLRNHPAAHEAVDYLKSRALSGETARNFGIGFAPPGWDNLLKNLGQTDEAIGLLKESGLLIERTEENKRYDRFRHRIMFPIRDVRGRTIGFGGRVLGDDKPKYLNSPETPLFHKGRELYGLFEANQKLRDIPNLLVVEGYMDVILPHQEGFQNFIASMGTSLTTGQVYLLKRFSPQVTMLYDADAAGVQATLRGLDLFLEQGVKVKVISLSKGYEPDTFIQDKGREAFSRLLSQALPLIEWRFQLAKSR
ncbi:hypothetical protein LCGC14_2789300, partial [marine sediment metagenome]